MLGVGVGLCPAPPDLGLSLILLGLTVHAEDDMASLALPQAPQHTPEVVSRALAPFPCFGTCSSWQEAEASGAVQPALSPFVWVGRQLVLPLLLHKCSHWGVKGPPQHSEFPFAQ